MDEEDYASYDVVDVEESVAESGAFMFLDEGHVYHYVGWLRRVGRECRFLKYRHGAKVIVVAEQTAVCEDCKRRMRELVRTLGIELVELRARWCVSVPEACHSQPFFGNC